MSNVFSNNFRPAFRGSFGNSLERPFDSSTLSLISNMSTQPSASRIRLIDNFIVSLKNAAIWDKLDVINFTAAEDAQSAHLNWITPTATPMTPVNSPTFTANRGYAGNGTTSYVNTNFNPSTATKLKLNGAFHAVYINTATGASAAKADLGAADATGISLIRAYDAANTIAFRLNQFSAASTVSASITSEIGLTAITRVGVNSGGVYKNGVRLGNATATSTNIPVNPYFIGASNNAGTPISFSNRRNAMFAAGAALTDAENITFYDAVYTYLTAIGAA